MCAPGRLGSWDASRRRVFDVRHRLVRPVLLRVLGGRVDEQLDAGAAGRQPVPRGVCRVAFRRLVDNLMYGWLADHAVNARARRGGSGTRRTRSRRTPGSAPGIEENALAERRVDRVHDAAAQAGRRVGLERHLPRVSLRVHAVAPTWRRSRAMVRRGAGLPQCRQRHGRGQQLGAAVRPAKGPQRGDADERKARRDCAAAPASLVVIAALPQCRAILLAQRHTPTSPQK